MPIGEKLYIMLLGLTLCSMTVAQPSPTTNIAESSLTKGTKVISKANSTNEFYVIAENDEPKLKAILIEGKKPTTVTSISAKNSRKSLSRANAQDPVKLPKSLTARKVVKITKARRHMPSKMELALNNALEKAIRKKQFESAKLKRGKTLHKINQHAFQAKLSAPINKKIQNNK